MADPSPPPEVIEAVAESAVKVAEIQADRDVKIAEISAENNETMQAAAIEQQGEDADVWLANELDALRTSLATHAGALSALEERLNNQDQAIASLTVIVETVMSQSTPPKPSPEEPPTPEAEKPEGAEGGPPEAKAEESPPPPKEKENTVRKRRLL